MSNGEHRHLIEGSWPFEPEAKDHYLILPVCGDCIHFNPGEPTGFCIDCLGGDDIFRRNYFKRKKEEC